MNYNELFDRLGLGADAEAMFKSIDAKTSKPEFSYALQKSFIAFGAGDAEFGEYMAHFAESFGITPEELTFYVYMRLAMRAVDEYAERAIETDIFFNTMKSDFIPTVNAYFKKRGKYGIASAARRWIGYPLALKIFNLGILRFQIAPSRYDVKIGEVEIKKGEPCISVHIKKGNFDEAECEAAYAVAREFFAKHFDMMTPVFFCYSWLMQPWLLDVLPKDSKIAKFQRKYRNIDFVEDPGDVLRWVFPTVCENPADYPEDTTVQRATKARILSGEIIGYGAGVRL